MTEAAGAAVQAAAALTGEKMRNLSEHWALPLTCVAKPSPEKAGSRSKVRAAYGRFAKADHF